MDIDPSLSAILILFFLYLATPCYALLRRIAEARTSYPAAAGTAVTVGDDRGYSKRHAGPLYDHESENNTPRPLQFPEAFSQTMATPTCSPAGASTQGRSSVAMIRQAMETNPRPRPNDSARLSTAILQDRLLPRRHVHRHKHRVADDLNSSDESDGDHDGASGDDDKLSYLPRRRDSTCALGPNTTIRARLNL